MRHQVHFFWGAPCCKRLKADRISKVLKEVTTFSFAQGILQADTLVVVGSVTYKQVPFLLDAWSRFALPAHMIHLAGCERAVRSYALLPDLKSILTPDLIINACSLDDSSLAKQLRDLQW